MGTNRPYVTFRCDAFNATEEREIFERPGNFGDDVADWLADRLGERGWETEEAVEQDDLGWFVTFGRDRDTFELGVSALNPEEARWLAWVDPEVGFFGGLFGGRNRAVPDFVLAAIHECLSSDPLVTQIRWHTREDFRRGNFEEGAEAP